MQKHSNFLLEDCILCFWRFLIYNRDLNALWSLINRLVIWNINNHRFINYPQCFFLLDRLRKGFSTREDIEFFNTRVVGSNLSLPSYENWNGDDVTYACSTNAERNLITDNNFGNVLKMHHPKIGESFSIPLQNNILVTRKQSANKIKAPTIRHML